MYKRQSKSYAKDRAKLINLSKAAKIDQPGVLESGDTIYLTAADQYGNMISLIQSNYRGMGSGMMPPGLGFMLQDRGERFSLDKNHRNALEGGKRPFHTIIPAFVTKDGKPFMSFGVMGGATQPQAHAQIIINMIDFGLNLQEAGDAPRIVHSGSSQPTDEVMTDGGTLSIESGFGKEIEKQLGDLNIDENAAKKNMNDTKEDAGYFKVYADILNHLFLFVLNLRSNVHTEGLNKSRQIIDLEYMLRENCKLSRQLQTETKNSRTKKEEKKSAKLIASQFSLRHIAGECVTHGLFPLVQVERTLRIIKHEKMYLDETNSVILSNYLQKVALVLLETLNEKVELSRNQENGL